VDKYDSAITYVDAEIGVLMQLLEQRGLGNNTVVIVTSDHGESLGQHDMQFHGIALYLEQIHVPLMLRYPGRIGPGLRVEPPVSNAALAATVMDLIGTGEQNFFPGRGLSGILTKGERITNSQNPISELAQNEIVIDPDRQARNVEPTAMDGDMKSVLTPQWHLIEHRTLGDQLYNWVADPAEVNNLIQTPQGKVATQTLKSEITQHSHP
jgi:arylsulfatase A-like enzyme